MSGAMKALIGNLGDTARDLMPIILIVGFFQAVVLRQSVDNLPQIAIGFGFVLLGLAVFIRGLEMALFPLGEALANALALRGSLLMLVIFAFGMGFGTTVAEPALIAVAEEATEIMAAAGVVAGDAETLATTAQALRYTVAASVGTSLVLGVFRILKGWPIQYLIIGGYVIVVALTAIAPEEIIGIAYDSGGVTTSTITVPLVTALGVGLASVIKGRNPMVDGFGLIAFASLMPIIFVLVFGLVVAA